MIERDGRLVGAVALALVLLPQAIVGVVAPPPNLSGEEPASWTSLVTILVALAGIVGQIAIIRLALGPSISVGSAIAHGFRRLLPGFLALLLFAIAVGLGLLPLLVAIGGVGSIEAVARGEQPSGAAAGAILLVVLIALLLSVRFQMLMPVAAGESGGPVHIIKRSWQLTAGHYFRLLGFLLLLIVVAVVLLGAAQILGGVAGRLAFGDIKPFTVAALIVALLVSLAQAVFTTGTSVMLGRIYAQLSGGAGDRRGEPA